MAKRNYTAEEIVAVLGQVEASMANGKATPQACRESGITEQTYYRWRKEYGGLKLEQAKRMKELEKASGFTKAIAKSRANPIRLGLGRSRE
jgi:putative transposase